ncbi:NUDIX hydrolase [Bacillus niameyensis]|uniref:NUDIX hydrolase n=1 Tax=Bacillus niameyensis TaxID=1522308 RepID=UPI0007859813|nr:8-oxo-dGTP diphosphatase [Bacillus niameyensis]
MLKYTLCFIRKGNQLLLLNRKKNPNMGLWNGVGGKIERNETPIEGILRETLEETGISLSKVDHAGDVIWESSSGNSGMYVFIADLPVDVAVQTPIQTDEGILDWKEIDWVLDPQNKGVVDNIHIYLPNILEGQFGYEYKFIYEDWDMKEYKVTKSIEALTL